MQALVYREVGCTSPVALCRSRTPTSTPTMKLLSCALAFLNLLGTFFERPRSKKLPRTDAKQAPLRRAEEFTSAALTSRLTSVRSTATQLNTLYALAFLNLLGAFFERPPDRQNFQELTDCWPILAGGRHFYWHGCTSDNHWHQDLRESSFCRARLLS